MPFIDEVVDRLPEPIRALLMRHHELIKFGLVGGTTFVFDMVIYYLLTLTVLEPKPVVARVISATLATVLSYVLNREWAFKNRGGRERSHEALLFFGISGIGVILSAAPLWVGNNVFDLRSNLDTTDLVVVDFVLGFIIGNILQMAFRFWALRKFAFPEQKHHGPDPDAPGPHPGQEELTDEELGRA